MSTTTLSAKRRIAFLVGLLSVVALSSAAFVWSHYARVPKRFAVVVPDRLYRSGTVTPQQLEWLQREHGIGRVISLLAEDDPVTRAEHTAGDRLGIEWYNIPLRGNGASTPPDRSRILELLTVPDSPPTLVHCAAGVNRTGLAVGLYRLHCQHWTLDEVMAELRSFDFEDLPKHENLRQALAEAAAATSAPSTRPAVE